MTVCRRRPLLARVELAAGQALSLSEFLGRIRRDEPHAPVRMVCGDSGWWLSVQALTAHGCVASIALRLNRPARGLNCGATAAELTLEAVPGPGAPSRRPYGLSFTPNSPVAFSAPRPDVDWQPLGVLGARDIHLAAAGFDQQMNDSACATVTSWLTTAQAALDAPAFLLGDGVHDVELPLRPLYSLVRCGLLGPVLGDDDYDVELWSADRWLAVQARGGVLYQRRASPWAPRRRTEASLSL